MEHSAMFSKIKDWYGSGIWTPKQVWNAVGRRITEEEYKKITGNDYSVEGV